MNRFYSINIASIPSTGVSLAFKEYEYTKVWDELEFSQNARSELSFQHLAFNLVFLLSYLQLTFKIDNDSLKSAGAKLSGSKSFTRVPPNSIF